MRSVQKRHPPRTLEYQPGSFRLYKYYININRYELVKIIANLPEELGIDFGNLLIEIGLEHDFDVLSLSDEHASQIGKFFVKHGLMKSNETQYGISFETVTR